MDFRTYTYSEMFEEMNAEEDERARKMAEAEFEYNRSMREIERLERELDECQRMENRFNYLKAHSGSPSELYMALAAVGQAPASLREVTEIYNQLKNY